MLLVMMMTEVYKGIIARSESGQVSCASCFGHRDSSLVMSISRIF